MEEQTVVKRLDLEESESDSDSDYELAPEDSSGRVTYVQSEGSTQIGTGHSIVTHRDIIHSHINQNVHVNVTAHIYIQDGSPRATIEHQHELEPNQNSSGQNNLNLNFGQYGSLQIPLSGQSTEVTSPFSENSPSQNGVHNDQGQPEVKTPLDIQTPQLTDILSCRPNQFIGSNHGNSITEPDRPGRCPVTNELVTSSSSTTPSQTTSSEVEQKNELTRSHQNQKYPTSLESPEPQHICQGCVKKRSSPLNNVLNRSTPKSTNSQPVQYAKSVSRSSMITTSRVDTRVAETTDQRIQGRHQAELFGFLSSLMDDLRTFLSCETAPDADRDKVQKSSVIRVDTSDQYFAVHIDCLPWMASSDNM